MSLYLFFDFNRFTVYATVIFLAALVTFFTPIAAEEPASWQLQHQTDSHLRHSLSQAVEAMDHESFITVTNLLYLDSPFPKMTFVEDYIVISNFDWELMSESELDTFVASVVNTQACLSRNDLYFLPTKQCLIKASPDYLSAVQPGNLDADLLAGAAITIQLCGNKNAKNKVSKSEQKKIQERNKEIEKCQTTCTAVTRAGELACVKLPNLIAQMGCVAVLEITLARCQSCCETGMDNCFDKFVEAMQPHIREFFNTKEI